MTDLDRAIAAAREAVQELDGFKHPELADAYLAHCVGTLRDLLAALDAARGEAVAWALGGELERALHRKDGGHGGLVCVAPDKCRDGMVPLFAAPPAAADAFAIAHKAAKMTADACKSATGRYGTINQFVNLVQIAHDAAALAVPAANVTPMRQPRADLARLVESINAAVYSNGDGLSVTEAIGALELAKLELLREQEQ